jgi:hypothetical protein
MITPESREQLDAALGSAALITHPWLRERRSPDAKPAVKPPSWYVSDEANWANVQSFLSSQAASLLTKGKSREVNGGA